MRAHTRGVRGEGEGKHCTLRTLSYKNLVYYRIPLTRQHTHARTHARKRPHAYAHTHAHLAHPRWDHSVLIKHVFLYVCPYMVPLYVLTYVCPSIPVYGLHTCALIWCPYMSLHMCALTRLYSPYIAQGIPGRTTLLCVPLYGATCVHFIHPHMAFYHAGHPGVNNALSLYRALFFYYFFIFFIFFQGILG